METVRGKLIKRIKRTSIVESFRFILDKKIDFIPGQFLQIIFDKDNYENKKLNKYLSFSSSPTKKYIEVTKKLTESSFSQKLKDLKTEDSVLIKAPLGNCIFNDEYIKIGFLIGGIGITPVISIMEYIVDKRLNTDAVLLYSNRTRKDIAFKKELDYWQTICKNIKVIYTITDSESKEGGYIFGRINKDLVSDKLKDYHQRIFFIFGPPHMVEAMKNICIEIGCRRENIKTEIFIGY